MSKFCELLWYTPRGFYWPMAERSEKDFIDGKDGDGILDRIPRPFDSLFSNCRHRNSSA